MDSTEREQDCRSRDKLGKYSGGKKKKKSLPKAFMIPDCRVERQWGWRWVEE